MATKKTPVKEEDDLMPVTGNGELDQAIDDLRGVLQADADGGVPGFDADFGMPGDAATDTASFGGGSSDLGGSDFGGDFGGSSDFGGSDFGGGDFDGSTAGDSFGSVQEPGSALTANMDLIMDIPIDVEIVLGSSRMQVSGLMNLEEGATIALDKKIGEPVEIMVNGRRIGKGEITVLENDDTRFGVKVTEVLSTRRT
ncbi:flagellar motor switch protein FliN/FliY [Pseudorhizobium tarimense]|uniref:Flagellar motor switch protein FliN n=1 Tax=Pseudorhizobium tarimense TaxID=1079109 RepID=A0ABV2HBN3_9HYPH|nr:flagellar motor switch protein FliN [Pseudorhizobium tarimense]MCJ8520869.1 flagellar motor switch protein FliN [Pseudorhizobium tarimense]